ncbi:flavodoxin family protein [Sulfurospirillum diekertiae]|uniref:Flavodoxin family protein n=1 Tax=Sulfurospirillum diekertiae TaxID=1854492 RepID=A0A290HVZ9_9BACT|nr:flavodoxin family protein [Sulfurospirillum diekertiae]ATB70016.1 iron-sulfur flavoprotein [Sulfurospirillum diekertiae]QIR75071.1 flavodoxin family protein [Sulfurospirillum diekertiae]QIR77735.1 flavodoxin family protein [Sulfurospirillum diekertiae]
MNVVAINGSPNKNGNTAQLIDTIAQELAKENISTEVLHIGNKTIRGCFGCGGCAKNQDERCIAKDDAHVNEYIQKMKEADGIILGTPVHWAGIAGTMKSFLDRAFYVSSANGNLFRHKVGASIVAVRRSGGVSTFDAMNHYLTYAEMIMPTTNYWNVAHGRVPGEVHEDLEGMQIARVLGKNMAFTLKMVQNAKENNVPFPEQEAKIMTNFVR